MLNFTKGLSLLLSSRTSQRGTALLAIALSLSACGGAGETSSPSPPPEQPRTLELANPVANPSALPPSDKAIPVTFTAVVSGSAYPDQLTLQEIDNDSNIINDTVAILKDNGEVSDSYRGDRVYTATVILESSLPSAHYYRVVANNNGDTVTSKSGTFWFSGCPLRARPSNPQTSTFDSSLNAIVFANEVLVTVQPEVAPDFDKVKNLISGVGGRVVGCIPSLNQFLIEFDSDGSLELLNEVIGRLELEADIVSATANAQIESSPFNQESTCTGRDCQWYLNHIKAPLAWDIAGSGSEQHSVAMLDFGIDCNHPELDCDPARFNQDPIDHGTGVASLINGNNQGSNDFVGVAWGIQLYPHSFLGSGGSQYKMSELITLSLADDNVKIINISASTAVDEGNQIRDALCTAIGTGRLVVAAAGNAYISNQCQIINTYPAIYNNQGQCSNGADLQSGLLIVGATDIQNELAEWANTAGADVDRCSNTLYVDLFAPGKDIYSASTNGSNIYANKNGTSFAAPLVSASAALLWSTNPSLSVAELHDLLIEGSSQSEQQTPNHPQIQDIRIFGKPLLNLYSMLGGEEGVAQDVSPNTFSFAIEDSAPLNSYVTSQPITITGISSRTPIAVSNGFYSINNEPFTSASGSIAAGQTLRLQTLSADTPATTVTMQVVVGDQIQSFNVTTDEAEASINSFDFFDQSAQPLETTIFSNRVTLTDITEPTTISIESAEYSLDGGDTFTSNSGTVNANQTIQLRMISANTPETIKTAYITIGDVTDTFSVVTEAIDTLPNAFELISEQDIDPDNVEPNSLITTTPIVIEGINTTALVTISGGEYSIDGGQFTRGTSLATRGQSIQVRLTSASTPQTITYTTLSIGDYSTTFQVQSASTETPN